MPEFFAAEGSPFSDDDAERLGPELVSLAEEGASSPGEIVEYARGHDTPLYEALEMDQPLNEVAEKWYRQRARKVASSIMVRVRTRDGSYQRMRAFHSVVVTEKPSPSPSDAGRSEGSAEDDDGRGVKRIYATIDQVRESSAMSEQVLDDALRRLEKWRDRYEGYRDVLIRSQPNLKEVFDAVERVT